MAPTTKYEAALIALVVVGCGRPPDPGSSPPVTTPPSAAATTPPPSPEAPEPRRDDPCSVDGDCDVLAIEIEIEGEHACCASCGTTAGTRAWAAKVRARCAGASQARCYALACPMGPMRPRCESGRCVAVP
jgi:hypothetical protein